MSDYPEHDKLKAISAQSQSCGEFLDWLATEKGAHLGIWTESGNYLLPAQLPGKTQLLAEFFGIDLKTLEQEKVAMLNLLRAKPKIAAKKAARRKA